MKKRGLFTAAACLSLWSAAAPAASVETYIHAGQLLADPGNGKVEVAKTIAVRDGRIVGIYDGYVGEGRVIDLRDRFILPGLIDSHVHLTAQSGPDARLALVTKSDAAQALDGLGYAARTLRAGFTTVVDLGGTPDAIYALRDAIEAGTVAGPRIIAAGGVAAHGGHGDIHGYRSDVLQLFRSPTLCSGADDCARAVRVAVQQGADVIKTAATGGVLSNTAAGLGQQMTDVELVSIVATAHSLGRQVAAHAHGVEGIRAAVRAGVDSIEHGSFIDADAIKMMKAKGTYLVPTLLAGDTVRRQAETADWMPQAVKAKASQVGPLMVASTRRAHEAGVKIAFGTDSGVSPHGDNAREFDLMVQAGLSPIEAIRAATVWGADHLGLTDTIGRIAPGMAADIVAVAGNPLTNIRSLEKMSFVMRDGKVVNLEPDAQ